MDTIATILMAAMLATAAVSDVRTGKIRNIVTVPCAAAGLALGALAQGVTGLADRALGAAVVLGAVLIVSTIAGLGGGDAKLLIAVGALKGFHFAIWAMLLTGVCGGALAVVMMVRRRAVRQTALNMAANILANAGGAPTDLAAGSALGKLPYSIAIALGSFAALALGA